MNSIVPNWWDHWDIWMEGRHCKGNPAQCNWISSSLMLLLCVEGLKSIKISHKEKTYWIRHTKSRSHDWCFCWNWQDLLAPLKTVDLDVAKFIMIWMSVFSSEEYLAGAVVFLMYSCEVFMGRHYGKCMINFNNLLVMPQNEIIACYLPHVGIYQLVDHPRSITMTSHVPQSVSNHQ